MTESRRERHRDDEPGDEQVSGATGTGATAAGLGEAVTAAAAEEASERKRRRRRRRGSEVEDDGSDRALKARNQLTPRWWIVLMVALMVVGLLWIVVFYLSSSQYPVPGWGNWNLVAGFGLVLVGFGMTTRWR
ncbi:cell division protein CrgA [Kineococcus sp. SYSU DK005]|uniref:cell division protein CrgA n=1 Tax=Kineococcus sp. SYSU DK005 TaxID=3383126 RepID=UPI003D7D8F4A